MSVPAAHGGPWAPLASDAALPTGWLGFSHFKDQPVIESKDPGDFLFSPVFTLNQVDFYVKP